LCESHISSYEGRTVILGTIDRRGSSRNNVIKTEILLTTTAHHTVDLANEVPLEVYFSGGGSRTWKYFYKGFISRLERFAAAREFSPSETSTTPKQATFDRWKQVTVSSS
jgi:hypothetical protein